MTLISNAAILGQTRDMNTHTAPPFQLSRRAEWLILAAILLIAAFMRLYRLDAVPPGLTHDEAAHGQDALAILHGARPVYETVGYGREPLYDYAIALTMAILNRTDYLAERLTSAFFGLLTIVATYLGVRRMFDAPTALLTAAMLAVSFWAIATSRQALRSVMLPALLAFAVFFWQRGITSLHSPLSTLHFCLAGLLLAATLWTYMAARATWILFVVGPALAFLFDRERFKQHWSGMIVTLVVGGLLAAPMFIWLQAHPGAEQRLSQLGEPLQLLASGNPSEVLKNTIEALGMFTFRADTLWLYNIPGRPWLDPITGVLFYAGLLIALWNWRKPAYLFALAWLVIGTFPSMMTGLIASSTRAVAIQPVLYLFPALAIVALARWLHQRVILSAAKNLILAGWRPFASLRATDWAVWIAAAVLVLVTGALSFRDYFITWADARDVRVQYHTTLFEISRYLDSQPSGGMVAISSIYPGHFHDPYSMAMTLRQRDLSLRWFDGRSALALPAPGARVIVQAISPVDPALASLFSSGARLADLRTLNASDLNPRFDVFTWNGAQPGSLRKPDAPTDLGRTLELVGYATNAAQVKPGGELVVVTFWRARSTTDPNKETVLFTHLLAKPEGPVLAQQDLVGYPAWQWQPGDEFAQVHRFIVPANTPPGQYSLEVGAYTRDIPSAVQPNPPTTRLTVYDGDKVTGDRVLLSPVQVTGD